VKAGRNRPGGLDPWLIASPRLCWTTRTPPEPQFIAGARTERAMSLLTAAKACAQANTSAS
jgi:hypothetical protein